MTATKLPTEIVEEMKTFMAEGREELKKVSALGEDHADYKEKVGKLEDKLEGIQESIRTFETRATDSLGGYSPKGVSELKEKGYASIQELACVNTLNVKGDSVSRRFSDEAEEVLHLQDTIRFAIDMLTDIKRRKGGEQAALNWNKDLEENPVEVLGEVPGFLPYVRQWDNTVKAFATKGPAMVGDQAGAQGADWIPIQYGRNPLDDIRLQTPVVMLFRHFPMASTTFRWPLLGPPVNIRIRRPQLTGSFEDSPTVGNRDWSPETFQAVSVYSDEISEDSLIPILPMIQANHRRAFSEGLSAAAINSRDQAASHFDNDYDGLTATDPQKAWNGMRYFCNRVRGDGNNYQVDAAAAKLDSSVIHKGLRRMGRYFAGRPGECYVLTSTSGFIDLLKDDNVLTIDKFGPQATIRSGELARIYGVPIHVAFGIEERFGQLDSTGVNHATPANNNRANTIVGNRNYWYWGDRRDVRFETDKDIVAGRNIVAQSARWAFNTPFDSDTVSTLPHTVEIVNIATT